MTQKTRMILAVIGLVIISILIYGLVVTGEDTETTTSNPETSKVALLLKCQNAVQPQLKNPSSMNVEYGASAIGEMSTGQLGAVMKYTAENSFGATPQSTVNCLFDTDGNLLEFAQAE